MDAHIEHFLSQRELAKRWKSPVATIHRFRCEGIGPRHIEVRGNAMYPVEEVQKFERACLFFSPLEVVCKQAS